VVPGLTLSGSIEVCSGLNFGVDLIGTGFLGLQPKLNSLTATASMGEYSDLTLRGNLLTGSFSPDPVKLATLEFAPIEIDVLGLPVWITPKVSIFVGANGSISTGVSTEATSAGSFTGGVVYSSGNWSPVPLTPSFQFSYQPPTLDASLSAKAYAGIEFDLLVYDSAGPSFKPDAYLDLEADIAKNPWWTLTDGIEGPMSLDVTFLGENLANYDLGNMFEYSHTIKSADGPFSPISYVPAIQSITPQQVTAGATGFNLTVVGSNFLPGAAVTFGNTSLSTTWLSSTQLTASVPSSLVSTPRTIQVSMTDPGTSGATSNSLSFTVTGNSVPAIIGLSPASLPAGSTSHTLTINGTGFLSSSTVTFNGVSHAATYISATQLTIPLTSADLATAGTYPVVVINPAPGGGASSAVEFTVTSTQAKNEFLYVAYNGLQSGDIAGFLIDPSSGQLQSVGPVLQTGDYVYSLAGDPQGQYLSLATYFSQGGGIAINNLPINATDGTLLTAAAQGSIGACCSPHYIAFDPSGYYLYDTVKVNGPGLVGTFSLDRSTGALTAVDSSSGGGGGGMAASPAGGYFATSDTGTWDHGPLLETYELTADGHLVSAYSQSAAAGAAPAGVAIDPTGSFVYTANSGDGTISGYAVSTGAALTPLSGSPFAFGTTLRSIAISPSGTFLFVSGDTGQVGVFMRNTSSGALTLQSTTHLPGWPTVGVVYSYLALDSTGQYLYVIATGNPPIYAYAVNPSTGALTSLQGSPYSVASETKAAALAVVQEKEP
jgi:6-phosphogluconolactonase (cycloisomerase 2 family)